MGVDEFYDMLPREFWNKMTGFYKLENLRERGAWERSRWETCLLINIQMPKNKRLQPTDLFKFEWERTDKEEEDLQKIKAKAELYKKRYYKLEKHK